MRITEDGSQHLTPANGNIFLALGFESEVAAKLLTETEKAIMDKLAKAALQRAGNICPDGQVDI